MKEQPLTSALPTALPTSILTETILPELARDAADVAAAPAAPLPPGPRPRPLIGSLPDMAADRLGFVTELHKRYGPVVHYTLGPVHMTQVTSAEGVQHVLQGNNHNYSKHTRTYGPVRWLTGNGLFTAEGDFWLRQRRLIQPNFHRTRIAGFGELMTSHAAALAAQWEQAAAAERTVDVAHDMTRLTLDIVVRALFGADVDRDFEHLAPAISALLEHVAHSVQHPYHPPVGFPTPHNRHARQALQTVDEAVHTIIQQRRRVLAELGDDPSNCGDMLDMLIQTRDAETGEGMSDQQLRDEVVTFFVAGHETTAGMLTWAWYLLSKQPEVARKLRSHVRSVLNGRLPTMADLPQLTYVRQVLDETLRLYPPIWITTRLALGDDVIEGCRVPVGSTVAVVPWVTHRLPEYWENPEGFDPDRFSAEASAKRPNFSYFPFGGGPRFCIGQNFALSEGALVLATLAQQFEMHLVPGRRVQIAPAVTLRPRGGLPMTAHRMD